MNPIFLRGTAFKIVEVISDRTNYLTKICKESRVTYCHIIRVVRDLEKRGLVILEKRGRRVFIKLTDKGEELKELIIRLNSLI